MYFLKNATVVGCSVLMGLCIAAYGQRPSEVVKWSATQRSLRQMGRPLRCLPRLRTDGMSMRYRSLQEALRR